MSNVAIGPIRRTVGLAVAVCLFAGCIGAAIYALLFGDPDAPHSWKLIAGLLFVGAMAGYWLWEDFIKATPKLD